MLRLPVLLIGLLLALVARLSPADAAVSHVSVYGIQGDDSRGHAKGEPFGTVNPACTDSAACAYAPTPVTIQTGDSLEFENLGKFKHTATGDLAFSPRLPEIVQPSTSSNNFSTGKLDSGQSVRIGPFERGGALSFYCLIHGSDQMRGTVSVQATATTTTTTTTAASSTTTIGVSSTTSTAASTTTTTTALATTTTATVPTTTSTLPPALHDIVVRFASNQPPFMIGTIVPVTVVVTNVGSVAETVRVSLSGDINYSAVQNVTVAAGASSHVVFEYPVPVRLQVTLTASGALSPGLVDATPANNSETKTFSTMTGSVSHTFPVRLVDSSPWLVPTRMSITIGDTVQWLNLSAGTHTVTSLLMAVLSPVRSAAGGGEPVLGGDFDRRSLTPGMTFSVTFDKPGVYPYLCFIHPYMAGVISVGLPGVAAPAGPVPDVLNGAMTLDGALPTASGHPPGIGEFCVAAAFELPSGAAVPGVVHCGDAATFQDLSLAAFDADATAAVRVMGPTDGAAPLVGRRIGGRWEALNNVHDLWFDRTGTKMFATLWHGEAFVTVDRMTNRIVDTTVLFTGGDVTHVMTNPAGTVGFLTLEGGLSGQIGLFDPNHPDHPVTGFIPLTPSRHPHGFWICGDGQTAVAALPMSNEVASLYLPGSPAELGGVRMVAPALGLYPVAVGTLPSCTKAYASNAFSNTVGVHDPLTGIGLQRIELPLCETCTLMGVPLPTWNVPMHLPPSPDGRFVVVSLAKAGRAAVIETGSDLVVALVDCGSGCHGSAFGPKRGGGFYWWGASGYQDKLAVLDMDTLTKAGDVPLNVRSLLTLPGLAPVGCPTCPTVAAGRAGAMGVVTFPLNPPWVQPVVLR